MVRCDASKSTNQMFLRILYCNQVIWVHNSCWSTEIESLAIFPWKWFLWNKSEYFSLLFCSLYDCGCRVRDMAIAAARNMLETCTSPRSTVGGSMSGLSLTPSKMLNSNGTLIHQPLPTFSSKFLGLNWRYMLACVLLQVIRLGSTVVVIRVNCCLSVSF